MQKGYGGSGAFPARPETSLKMCVWIPIAKQLRQEAQRAEKAHAYTLLTLDNRALYSVYATQVTHFDGLSVAGWSIGMVHLGRLLLIKPSEGGLYGTVRLLR